MKEDKREKLDKTNTITSRNIKDRPVLEYCPSIAKANALLEKRKQIQYGAPHVGLYRSKTDSDAVVTNVVNNFRASYLKQIKVYMDNWVRSPPIFFCIFDLSPRSNSISIDYH